MAIRRLPRLRDIPALPTDLTDQLVTRLHQLQPSVKADYLKSELTSKYVSSLTDPPLTRRTRAINKWLAAESENEATNDRLLTTDPGYQILPRVSYASFTDWCRRFVVDILGEYPPVDALIGSFSGGASTSRNRTQSHPSSKYLGKADVTARCLDVFLDLVEEMPGWLGSSPLYYNVVRGNVLFTVPKKTDVDRVAAKEPDLNMFIQKGLGAHIRRCLLRAGINLNEQGINRSLAQRGSVTGELATLDLASASDSVTYELVAQLLPEFWFTFLDASRCHVTVIDGEEHQNHMFSSMGNGFTFELESLLFYVLARAVAFFTGTRGVVSIYGDDIICPTVMSQDLISVLAYFGFQVNPDKSFTSGPFRESCGGHYWNGCDITPFYIREPIETLPQLINIANKLREWAVIPELGVLNPEVEEIWLWLKGFVPECLWGGEDTSFRYQLVSYDKSSARLHEEGKRMRTGDGGYFHWLNATWARDVVTDGVSTSEMSRPEGRLRLRPVREVAVARLQHLWISEIRQM